MKMLEEYKSAKPGKWRKKYNLSSRLETYLSRMQRRLCKIPPQGQVNPMLCLRLPSPVTSKNSRTESEHLWHSILQIERDPALPIHTEHVKLHQNHITTFASRIYHLQFIIYNNIVQYPHLLTEHVQINRKTHSIHNLNMKFHQTQSKHVGSPVQINSGDLL